MNFEVSVEKQYEKDKNLRREDVQALAEWARKQPHLPQITEFQLVLFLHSCYYHQEAAKKAIDNFFTIRTLCPDHFSAMTAEEVEDELSVGSINFLPEKTPEGYDVVLGKLWDPNPDHYRHVPQLNIVNLIMTLNLMQKGIRNGIVIVFDMKGVSFGHLTRVNLTAAKKHLYYVQEALPVRIKAIHHINVVPFIDKFMALIKPFMKKELMDILHFHTDSLESLYKFVPKKCLPEDYGGEAPPLAKIQEKTKENLLANMDLFHWLDTQKIDANKRPDKDKDPDRIFGAAGSFKKLEVD